MHITGPMMQPMQGFGAHRAVSDSKLEAVAEKLSAATGQAISAEDLARAVDANGDGVVSKQELRRAMKEAGLQGSGLGLGLGRGGQNMAGVAEMPSGFDGMTGDACMPPMPAPTMEPADAPAMAEQLIQALVGAGLPLPPQLTGALAGSGVGLGTGSGMGLGLGGGMQNGMGPVSE